MPKRILVLSASVGAGHLRAAEAVSWPCGELDPAAEVKNTLIANPVPGQETRNSDYVLENGAGVKVHNLPTLAHKLTRLLDEPARLQRMKAAARRLGRRRAAFDVAGGAGVFRL